MAIQLPRRFGALLGTLHVVELPAAAAEGGRARFGEGGVDGVAAAGRSRHCLDPVLGAGATAVVQPGETPVKNRINNRNVLMS